MQERKRAEFQHSNACTKKMLKNLHKIFLSEKGMNNGWKY